MAMCCCIWRAATTVQLYPGRDTLNLIGARDEESTNNSARFVE